MMQSPSQCHDLARRLADLEPGLSDGAARIRAEIEGRRDLAEVREQDRVRTKLRDAVTRVAESLEIDGLDATPLDTAVEALTDTVAARIGTLEANANQRKAAVAALQALGQAERDRQRIQRAVDREDASLVGITEGIAELDRRRSLVRRLRTDVEQARTEIVRRVFTTSINRVWQDLFIRREPEEPFVPAFRLPDAGGRLIASLETIHRDGASGGRPAAMLSAGNLNRSIHFVSSAESPGEAKTASHRPRRPLLAVQVDRQHTSRSCFTSGWGLEQPGLPSASAPPRQVRTLEGISDDHFRRAPPARAC